MHLVLHPSRLALGLVLAFAPFVSACRQAAASEGSQGGDASRGAELFQLCAQCHGTDGGGNHGVNAPAIAGLDRWYVEGQLRKFRSGVRGAHPDDVTGMQMRPMATSLRTDDDLRAVATHVAKLPSTNPAPVLRGGNPQTGAALFGPCQVCHGEKATGDAERKAPPLARANDWYLFAQIRKFKDGHRGAHPADAEGAQMLPWMSTLSDEQAIRDVVAHIGRLR